MLRRLLTPLITTLYPQRCLVCGSDVVSLSNGPACDACWSAARIFDGAETLCSKCGAYKRDGKLNCADLCGECEDLHFDAAHAVGVYERALAGAVVNLKNIPHLPLRVVSLLHGLLARLDLAGDIVIVPVPLSKRRRFERGHNQAEVIAEEIAKYLVVPMYSNVLIRTGHSQIHRVGMDKKAREATVKNVFVVHAPRLISGKHVLLVDDVFTSGSTASNCAKILKKNGAATVTVVTLARAVIYK